MLLTQSRYSGSNGQRGLMKKAERSPGEICPFVPDQIVSYYYPLLRPTDLRPELEQRRITAVTNETALAVLHSGPVECNTRTYFISLTIAAFLSTGTQSWISIPHSVYFPLKV